MTAKKTWLLTGLITAACFAVLYAIGAFKGLSMIAGAAGAALIMAYPLLGLIGVILSGTCFQIIGSSQFVGLPMSLGKLFGLLTLGAWGLHFWRNRPGITRTSQVIPLGLFLLIISLSAFVERLVPKSGVPLMGMDGLFRMLQVYLLFFLVANLAGESRLAFITALITLNAGMAISGIISLVEYFIPALDIANELGAASSIGAVVDRESIPGVEMRRVTGGVGDPNWLAYTAAAVLPLNLYLWRRFQAVIPRCLIVSAVGLECVSLVLSFTRSGFIGLAAGLAYLLWRRRLPVAPFAALTVLAVVSAPLWVPPGFIERMFSSRYLKEGSTPARRELFIDGVYAFQEKPFWGHGYGQFGYYFVEKMQRRPRSEWSDSVEDSIKQGYENPEDVGVHCLYLEIGVEYGLAGLIPFLLILVYSCKDLSVVETLGSDDDRELAICIAACILCFAVCGIFAHIKVLKIIWLLTGFAAALRRVVVTEAAAKRPAIAANAAPLSSSSGPAIS